VEARRREADEVKEWPTAVQTQSGGGSGVVLDVEWSVRLLAQQGCFKLFLTAQNLRSHLVVAFAKFRTPSVGFSSGVCSF
jgi:hypothetical protein